MPRRKRAKRALPASFKQRSTKSGGGKTVKKSNLTSGTTKKRTGGVRGVRPGDNFSPETVLVVKKRKRK